MKRDLKKEFFDGYAGELNYVDPKSLPPMYYGLMRLVIKKLREEGKIKLPDFGVIYLKDIKERNINDINGGGTIRIGSRRSVKFSPSKMLKQYFLQKDRQDGKIINR